MTSSTLLTRALPLGLTTSLLLGGLATAQDVKISKPVSRNLAVVAAQPTPLPPGQPGQPGQPANGQPGQAPMNPMGQPGDKPAGAADTSKPVSRAERPKPMANPEELKVRPDEEGKVRFNFHGQPWPEILQWLAEISNQSLDWQELPGDYLNLATQRAYSVEEARDMINRHLLDRGYTVLVNGEVLTVVNIKKLDPSLVPRVRPEDLAQRMPHEFVKVSFSLETMLAEEAAEEFKPMLSPNGKLTPLKSTNRVEGMDAVANLVEIYNVVSAEESTTGQEQLIKEFVLEHTRAADIAPVLYDLLGLDRPRYLATRSGGGGGGGGGGDMGGMMQMMQQMQQQFQQQMQQMQQNQGGAGGKGSSAPKKVQLILNPKKNSIVANAPADKMAIIIQAVKTLDVPNERADSLLMNNSRMQIYRLVSVDPEPIIQMLEEMGNLDPTTVLRVDKSNQSIIAYASLADQLTIKMLVTKLDGSGRRFEVIKLRRLPADYVAGTIDFMMNEGDKDKNSNNRNPFRYDYYMPFGLSGSGSGAKDQGKFRVDADVENNRLLLWANEIELQEIENLLAKLGEIPSPEAAQETTRVLDIGTPEDAELLLERLQQAAPQLVPNQIRPRVLPRRMTPKTEEDEAPAAQKKTPARQKAPVEAQPASNPAKSAQAPATKPFRSTPNSKRLLVNGRANGESKSGTQTPTTTTVAQSTAPQAEPLEQPEAALLPEFATEELLAAADLLLEEEVVDESATGDTLAQPQVPQTDETDDAEASVGTEVVPAETVTEDASTAGGEPMPPPVIRNPNARNQAPRNRPLRNPSAINITVSPDGKLILDSEDTQALDVLEELAAQMAPPRRDFKVFHLKNPDTWAYGVVLNLEKYFGVDKDKKGSGSGFEYSPYFGVYPSTKKDEGGRSLSKRRPLKFISDTDSHTILVTGADPAQLKVIEELINIYDKPPETDEKALRQTQIFQIRHSKASVIANAIKEVYRDLLSSNDPALQQNNKKDETQKSARESYTYIYGGASGSDSEQPESPIKFKGLLSIGVDDISNTLIISAQAGLLENIAQVIEALDEAARPTASTFQVVKVGPGLETSVLQQKLSKLLAPKPQPQQQPKGQPGQPGQPQQPQFNGQPAQEAAVAE